MTGSEGPGGAGPADPAETTTENVGGAWGWTLSEAEAPTTARLDDWQRSDAAARIWRKDPTFWPAAPASDVASRLGWLRAPEQSAALLGELDRFSAEVREEGIEHVVLLGMGGSSLAAEVIATTLPCRAGAPRLTVLDSTHPLAVRACLRRAPVARSLYLVSSKSGTTLEPNALYRYFWAKAQSAKSPAGRRFVAITDPGTPLATLATERAFRTTFPAPPDIGGRYSALTVFGLVPAALIGVDVGRLLGSARTMVARCSGGVSAADNPGLRLGAALGELARQGRDKLLFLPSEGLRAFPSWAEQLVAESLGKRGRGIVPVADAPPPSEFPNGDDVVYVRQVLGNPRKGAIDRALETREAAGAPVLRFSVGAPEDLGAEFFRWELAIAACGSVIEVDPFDQPDVEHAKELAREAMARPPATDAGPAGGTVPLEPASALVDALRSWLASVGPRDYVAVQAFVAAGRSTDAALARLTSELRRRVGVVVTLGIGPRFLHSTGQLHKGGPPSGRFLQIVDSPRERVEVPELGLEFGRIVAAEAQGDRGALAEKHRQLLAVDVGPDAGRGIDRLRRAVSTAEPIGHSDEST